MSLSTVLSSNSFIKKARAKVREQIIFLKHESVASYWRPIIKKYMEKNIAIHSTFPKQTFPDEKIIWQYWAQGLKQESLPEVVKICFDSVDKFKGEYRVIRLSDDSVKEYIDFPDFVWEKRKNPEFKPAFFSDLLRIALLQTYGGIWLDATVLLSSKIPEDLRAKSFFAYNRCELAENQAKWKNIHPYYWNWSSRFKVNVLNSVLIGSKGTPITLALLHLLLHYWQSQDKILDYFFFQILYHELTTEYFRENLVETVDDTLPHLLQAKIFKFHELFDYLEIFARQNIHKLTYFSGK